MHLLTTFAAFSMAGTVLLSLLPEGGIKRTAGMAIGLLTLSCWVHGIAALLNLSLPEVESGSALVPTAVSLSSAVQEASTSLAAQWEDSP